MRIVLTAAGLIGFMSVVVVFGQKTPVQSPAPKVTVSSNPKDPLTNDLVDISSRVFEAGIKGDRETIDQYLADDYLEIDAMGELRDKEWNLKNFLSSNEKLAFDIAEPKLTQRSGFALLYYTLEIRYDVTKRLTGNSNSVTDTVYPKLRVIDTYVKTKTGWQMIASSRVRFKN